MKQKDLSDIEVILAKSKTLRSLEEKISYSEQFDTIKERLKIIQKIIRKEKSSKSSW